jgi:hypothetical protein
MTGILRLFIHFDNISGVLNLKSMWNFQELLGANKKCWEFSVILRNYHEFCGVIGIFRSLQEFLRLIRNFQEF